MSDLTREDHRAALLALLSQHLPEVAWDDDERVARIVCSCGRALYVGHLTTLIVNRFYGEEMAEWERELLARPQLHVVTTAPPTSPDPEPEGSSMEDR